jgi:hypothetical protein
MKRIFGIVSLIALLAVAYAHWVLPGKVETSMNGVLPHEPYAISDRAKRLHESLFIADLHSDSLLWKRDLLEESDVGHMDLPRLRRGNVALQVFSAADMVQPLRARRVPAGQAARCCRPKRADRCYQQTGR